MAVNRQFSEMELIHRARQLLHSHGPFDRAELKTLFAGSAFPPLAPDGSTRRFWRLRVSPERVEKGCIIAAPALASKEELAEARSAWEIGRHLKNCGVPVPKIYGWDEESGLLVFEDLGDTRLYDTVFEIKAAEMQQAEQLLNNYTEVVTRLAHMQINGGRGFDRNWCWDSPCYDSQLMVERESGYFLRAFWQGFMAQEVPGGIEEEFSEIARRAGEAPAGFFLHRDFQSRNIMLHKGMVQFIDFQGGRFGPLGYDLASLLIDPYCGLSPEFQDRLIDTYLSVLSEHIEVNPSEFMSHYSLLALQRNLQIIGAFSFLSTVRKKSFFRRYIKPSTQLLQQRLSEPCFDDFPLVRETAARGANLLTTTPPRELL